jgi:hypothetical protein
MDEMEKCYSFVLSRTPHETFSSHTILNYVLIGLKVRIYVLIGLKVRIYVLTGLKVRNYVLTGLKVRKDINLILKLFCLISDYGWTGPRYLRSLHDLF